jgi:cytochrome c5
MRRFVSIFIVTIFLFAGVGLSLAGPEKGNARKGKYTFRKNCRTCHVEGGSAKALKGIDKLACKAEWAKISEADQTDIYAHLWGHAFDSPAPEKCE